MKPLGTLHWLLPDGRELDTESFRPLNLLGHADMVEEEHPELRIRQACGGQAECGTCRVRILSGELTPCRGEEARLMDTHRKAFAPNERLACQARPRSERVVVELPGSRAAPPDLREEEGIDPS